MATCRDVVTRALRMAGIIPRTANPAAEELRDGQTALQTFYDACMTGGMFGRLTDVYESASYEANEGERVYLSAGTVTLPSVIDDCRKPRDLAAIEVFDDDGRKAWIWDRTEWVRVDSLAYDDDAPLANRGVNGLAACVAMAYADEFGEAGMAAIGPGIRAQALTYKMGLSLKLGSEREPATSVYY